MVRAKARGGQAQGKLGRGNKQPVPRAASPSLSDEDLYEGLKGYIHKASTATAFNFGVYHSIAVGQAVNGFGLLLLSPFILFLLQLLPCLLFKYTSLKAALGRNADWYPTLVDASRTSEKWAGDTAERIMCICHHVRRLKQNATKFRQAAQRMDAEQTEQLKTLVSGCQPVLQKAAKAAGKASPRAASRKASPKASSQASPKASPKAQPVQSASSRALQRNLSEISVDSQGFPMMLKTARTGSLKAATSPMTVTPTKRQHNVFESDEETAVSDTPTRLYPPVIDDELLGSPVAAKKPRMTKPAAASPNAKMKPAAASPEPDIELAAASPEPKKKPAAVTRASSSKSLQAGECAVLASYIHTHAYTYTYTYTYIITCQEAAPPPVPAAEDLKDATRQDEAERLQQIMESDYVSYRDFFLQQGKSNKEWCASDARALLIKNMSKSEVQRRRFEALRPGFGSKHSGQACFVLVSRPDLFPQYKKGDKNKA
jgi:hypothetical protein